MSLAVAVLNVLIGCVYTSYGYLTVVDMRRGWSTMGFSHFGAAWICMAYTCGPHHLVHGMHGLGGRQAGSWELVALAVGAPAGITWFLGRIEALMGGRGDRMISGTPLWLRFVMLVLPAYALTITGVLAWLLVRDGGFSPRLTPNVALVWLYLMVGFYLLRTQLDNHRRGSDWSLSGLALTAVFPTCALMHASYLVNASVGHYTPDAAGLAIDWLSVPAAIYFLWIVRLLCLGSLDDWNRASLAGTTNNDVAAVPGQRTSAEVLQPSA